MTPKKVTVNNKDKSEVEISVVLDAAALDTARTKALAEYKKSVHIDGFREGKAPDALVEKHVGENALLEKAATIAIDTVYPIILTEHKIDAIGRPEVQVTKLAFGNDLEFTAKTAVFPEVTVPDYKKIAQKTFGAAMPSTDATDKEVQEALTHMRRERARVDAFEKAKASEDKETDFKKVFETVNALKDDELPELDNAFVQTLGEFENLDAFKQSVRENIGKEKALREEEKRRATMLDALTKDTKVAIPAVMARGEARRIEAEFAHMLQQNGTDMDTYLAHVKKTREDLEKEWLQEGEKRATLQLAINEIAKKENIRPDEATVQKEIAHLQEHYKDAKEEDLRAFVENQEQNKAVLTFLESLGK